MRGGALARKLAAIAAQVRQRLGLPPAFARAHDFVFALAAAGFDPDCSSGRDAGIKPDAVPDTQVDARIVNRGFELADLGKGAVDLFDQRNKARGRAAVIMHAPANQTEQSPAIAPERIGRGLQSIGVDRTVGVTAQQQFARLIATGLDQEHRLARAAGRSGGGKVPAALILEHGLMFEQGLPRGQSGVRRKQGNSASSPIRQDQWHFAPAKQELARGQPCWQRQRGGLPGRGMAPGCSTGGTRLERIVEQGRRYSRAGPQFAVQPGQSAAAFEQCPQAIRAARRQIGHQPRHAWRGGNPLGRAAGDQVEPVNPCF